MTVYSKELFDRVAQNCPCSEFIHPWSTSCFKGLMMFSVSAFIGGIKMSLLMQTIQVFYKRKNLNRTRLLKMCEQTIRFGSSSCCVCFLFMLITCLYRNVRGKFDYYYFLSVPASLAGIALLLMSADRRFPIFLGTANSVFVSLISVLDFLNVCKKSVKREIVFFMLSNAGLLYFLRLWKRNLPKKPLPEFWIYYPSPVRDIDSNLIVEKKNVVYEETKQPDHCCPHSEPCLIDILKSTCYYFSWGVSLGILRSFVTNLTKPGLFANYIFRRSNLNLGIFLGTYVLLAKATNCLLCRLRGVDSEYYALLAGLLSAFSYYFYPNTNVCLTAFTLLISIMWSYYDVNNALFKGFPIQIIVFMFTTGLMFQFIGFFPDHVSKIYFRTLCWCSDQRLAHMMRNYKAVMESI